MRMYEIDFADMQSLGEGYSVEEKKAVVTPRPNSQFVDCRFAVPTMKWSEKGPVTTWPQA